MRNTPVFALTDKEKAAILAKIGQLRGRLNEQRCEEAEAFALDPANALYHDVPHQLNSINSAIEVLGGENSLGHGRKRRMSASARARIAKAQRARWAKVRAAKN